MTNDGRKINILWTGGLDSSFRIVELSRCQCIIQPYYIVFGNKESLNHELNAINKISRILRKDKRTKAELLDPIIVDEEDIPRDVGTFDSWMRLMRGVSWQYYVFAKYASQQHLEMEMSVRFSPFGSVSQAVNEALLIPHPDRHYDVQIIDKNRADQDTLAVFGDFCFPKSLYHKTKREEIDILRGDGYGKVVKHVWFCFQPIWGYPCGHCSPCISSEKEGMKISRIGKMLYPIHHKFKKETHRRVIKLNYDYDIQKVSDMFLANAIDPETGEVKKTLRLNETGILILEALQDGVDIEEVTKRLTDGFDVEYETAKNQASAFIAKLNL